jgi:hypothetical protein
MLIGLLQDGYGAITGTSCKYDHVPHPGLWLPVLGCVSLQISNSGLTDGGEEGKEERRSADVS